MRPTRIGACLLAFLATACGGRARTACTGAAVSADTDAGDGQAAYSGCPASPSPGACCSGDKVPCSYGSDPDPTRRDFYLCKDGQWTEQAATSADDGGMCPSSIPTVADGSAFPCEDLGVVCAYEGALCNCLSANPPDSGVAAVDGWQCDTPSTRDPRCPLTIPNSGTPCTTPLLDCEYLPGGEVSSDGGIAPTVSAECDPRGYWTWASTY